MTPPPNPEPPDPRNGWGPLARDILADSARWAVAARTPRELGLRLGVVAVVVGLPITAAVAACRWLAGLVPGR